MLHPSYTDLMRIVNKDIEEGETKIVNSRYSIVLATSKRARQIIDGSTPLVQVKQGEKPLSVAIDELYSEQLKIIAENSGEDYDLQVTINDYGTESDTVVDLTIEKNTPIETSVDVDSLIEDYTDE
jgi:DNA-directed RNA polymerase subunit omega